jgi:hypothetical protein
MKRNEAPIAEEANTEEEEEEEPSPPPTDPMEALQGLCEEM